tara:strand:+ start:1033 stop:1173 length:141 start_codon:yes stop_codon:yes gene_type:complete
MSFLFTRKEKEIPRRKMGGDESTSREIGDKTAVKFGPFSAQLPTEV